MGGPNSGRWDGRLRCESARSIDVREWQRRGDLENVGGGFVQLGRVGGVWVNVQEQDLLLSFTMRSGEQRQELVELARTPCNYGGSRVWFVCPACSHRAAKLYQRQDRFACRRCQGLRY